MGYVNETDARRLLKDGKLLNEIIDKVVDDPEVLNNLAENVAGEISGILEDDPEFKQRILNSALSSPDFKKRIIKELVDELD